LLYRVGFGGILVHNNVGLFLYGVRVLLCLYRVGVGWNSEILWHILF
jgi:hypothetical protein